jgi:hypothetical protein
MPNSNFDWNRLPPEFHHLIPWLKKFEHLQSEIAVYEFAAAATPEQSLELAEFRELLNEQENSFAGWCEANDRAGNVAAEEAFQAGWMFLLVDFANWEKNPDGTLKVPR